MQIFEQELPKNFVEFWKVISYLASDSECQIGLLGVADEWFYTEKESKNKGANFLIGAVLMTKSSINGVWNMLDPNLDHVNSLNQLMDSMLEKKDEPYPEIWSINALTESEVWLSIRVIASQLIEQLGLFVNLPKRPFLIQENIDVANYLWCRNQMVNKVK